MKTAALILFLATAAFADDLNVSVTQGDKPLRNSERRAIIEHRVLAAVGDQVAAEATGQDTARVRALEQQNAILRSVIAQLGAEGKFTEADLTRALKASEK